jgi:galactokinase/mevalonate kinase-like predicted kinase
MRLTFSAPGRCGILGNPSDIYGGLVLSASIVKRNTVTLVLGDGPEEFPDDLRLWNAAVSALPVQGIRAIQYHSEVPRSSGLAGSTALLTAIVAALRYVRGESFEASAELAELVRDIERNQANVVCGFQDAYMTVHGGVQLMNFAGKHPVRSGPNATLLAQEVPLPFLLVTTGVERLSGSVHGPMAERWLSGETAVVSGIDRIQSLTLPGLEALRRGDYRLLAELMTENQAIIQALGGSGDAVDNLIENCLACGAIGAKLAGAGMGGTVLALTEQPAILRQRLEERGYSVFNQPASSAGVRLEEVG